MFKLKKVEGTIIRRTAILEASNNVGKIDRKSVADNQSD